jgi:phosphate transport system protein
MGMESPSHSARKHFDERLTELKAMIVEMGAKAERMLGQAVSAVVRGDEALAREVIAEDDRLDEMELEVQSTAIVLMAREAPVAADARLIAAVLSIAGEIERVGDDAVSIAKKAISLPSDFPREFAADLEELSEKSRAMLISVLRAFSDESSDLLDGVIAADTEVDMIWKNVRRKLKDAIRANVDFLETGYKLVQACHHLEYASDHVVAIAEKLEFARTGNLVRFSRASY